MLASIFVYINLFIVLVFGIILMVSHFTPETTRKLLIASSLLILLPIIAVSIMNMEGEESHRINDLIFMRGGSIGMPVVIGYGIGFGLFLSKLRTLIFGKKIPQQGDEQ